MALSEQFQQRSDLIGTQVITRDTGKKLGVVNQLWVDIDQRAVVVLGVRSTLITGEQRYMDLESVSQIGDVILVEDERAIENVNIYDYSTLINHEVVTETGELLGKVRGFKFDSVSGEILALIIASVGLPLIPSQLISTYELPVGEIVSSGPERLIVFEGAEERMNQLTVGLMERLGLSAPPWESEEDEYRPVTTPTSNQLGSGMKTSTYAPPARPTTSAQPVTWQAEEAWEEEPIPARVEEERRVEYRYQENSDEVERWNTEEVNKDAWEEEEDYQAPPIKLPERQKVAEYEREPDY